jgi:hypothetical protein
LVHGRGPFTRRALFAAALSLAMLAALSPAANADRQTDLLSIGPNGGNGAADVFYGGTTPDGSHVYFTTTESLVSADTDSSADVYERVGTTTTLISTGPTGGNGPNDASFGGVSADGAHVFFQTAEQLTSADADSSTDVYERFGGTTTEVSVSAIGGNTGVGSFYAANSADGSHVFFTSFDKLSSDDTDSSRKDVYDRSGGTVTLMSSGGNGAFGADFDGAMKDGSTVFFHTQEALAGTDTDASYDLYKHAGGVTTQVSVGQINGNGGFDTFFGGFSPDGSHVFFQTRENLTSSDTDSNLDVYDRSGGTTTEVSLGPSGGNGAFDSSFTGASADGSKVWFQTRESLVSGDTDGGCEDPNGNPTLPCLDVYQRSGASTAWISIGGNGSDDASFAAGSEDGSHVLFHTTERLGPADTDVGLDVYDRSGGTTTLISGGTGNQYAFFGGMSKDAARVFFYTDEQLVSADTDVWFDVYERYSGETTLVSTGPASTSGDNSAWFDGASDDGAKAFFETDEKLTSADTDSRTDIYGATALAPGFPRPKGATPAIFSLVPAYQPCLVPNSTHGAPLANGSCKPPTQDSGILTVGSPDANGHAASSNSQIKFRVVAGNSDVDLTVRVNDVLCRATNAACPTGPLSDFAGRLLIKATLRLTDKYNGSPAVESATVQDFDVQMPIQCVATAVTNAGGDCSGSLSVNAAYPGAVTPGQRANWQIQKLQVLDPGPNGTGFGAGCPATCGDGDEAAFMRPGVFIP